MESAAKTNLGKSSTSSNYNDYHVNNDEENQPWSYAMQLASSSVLPMVMQAVVELDVLEIMAEAGPGTHLSVLEIVSRIPTRNPDATAMLDRMLQLLANHSVLTCSVQPTSAVVINNSSGSSDGGRRLYGLAPVAQYFVRNKDGVSLRPLMSVLQDKVFMDSWYELKGAFVDGGIPFNRVHGTHAFAYCGKDPRFNDVFNKAMCDHTNIVIRKILESYKGFEQLKHLVDVGGGLGVALNIITSKYPSIKGINFDLPHVIQRAPTYPGVEHVGGDMFVSVPKGDAIFMKWILHDWSDDHCLELLKNCHKALPENGKVIVVEGIVPLAPPDNTMAAASAAAKVISQIDMIMLTQNTGGMERTQPEFQALAAEAGFTGIRFECFASNFCVMEFYK
ncbi:unnamed protein product [Camellia sinensis]